RDLRECPSFPTRRSSDLGGWDVAFDEPGVDRVGQVEELDVERELGVGACRAGMDDVAAPEGHHHQQLLLRPYPQLTGGDAHVAGERWPDLPDDVGLAGMGN